MCHGNRPSPGQSTAESLPHTLRPNPRPIARTGAGITVSEFVPRIVCKVVPEVVVRMIPVTTHETMQETTLGTTCETTTETTLTTTQETYP